MSADAILPKNRQDVATEIDFDDNLGAQTFSWWAHPKNR